MLRMVPTVSVILLQVSVWLATYTLLQKEIVSPVQTGDPACGGSTPQSTRGLRVWNFSKVTPAYALHSVSARPCQLCLGATGSRGGGTAAGTAYIRNVLFGQVQHSGKVSIWIRQWD